MPINELLLREFDREMSSTQKTLERVPAEKWDWKPHEKSGSLGWMAGHVASLPGFTIVAIKAPELDVAAAPRPRIEGTPNCSIPSRISAAKPGRAGRGYRRAAGSGLDAETKWQHSVRHASV